MKDFYWEHDRNYFKVPYSIIREKAVLLCKEYGIISNVDDMLNSGMLELFDKNGNLLEQYAKRKLEYGKKAGMFGNIVSESTWANYLGD